MFRNVLPGQCTGTGVALLILLLSLPHAALAEVGRLDLPRGETLTFLVSGKDYARLTHLVVVRDNRGRAEVVKDVGARIGPSERKGRWVEIAAGPRAATGSYRIDGFTGKALTTVLPVVINVTDSSRQAKRLAAEPAERLFPSRRAPLSKEQIARARAYDPPMMTLKDRMDSAKIPAVRSVPAARALPAGTRVPALQTIMVIATGKLLQPVPREEESEPPPQEPPPEPAPEPEPSLVAFDAFNAAATSRSWQRAYLLSLLSWVSYFPVPNAQQLLTDWGLEAPANDFFDVDTLYFIGNSGSTQGFVAHNDDAIFVAFQGSTTNDLAQDWIDNDLDLTPKIMPAWGLGVIMHEGFLDAAAASYGLVRTKIQDLLKENPNRRLWITGHSLGGAVATITAFRLEWESGIDVQGVYTFGAPQVGNLAWRDVFDDTVSNVHRWNLQGDPVVSLLPPLAFSHIGSNNNLYNNVSHQNAEHGWSDPAVWVYQPGAVLSGGFSGAHMAYWCRLHTELTLHDGQGDQYPVPPSNTTPGCMD